jgi:hypothetical protein
VNLKEQSAAIKKMKFIVKKLRVKNNRSSKLKKKLIFYKPRQQWQIGITQASNAVEMMYLDLKRQYNMDWMRTAKLNQASGKNQLL